MSHALEKLVLSTQVGRHYVPRTGVLRMEKKIPLLGFLTCWRNMDSEKPKHSAKQISSFTNPEQVLKMFDLKEVQKGKTKLDC